MKKHEFTKYEIATYLRDYNRTLTYAIMNQDVPLYEVFKHHMQVDNRIQYSIKDYYYEMISIYEILLLSKFLTILYDNYFDNLLESSINKISIPDNIFINSPKIYFANIVTMLYMLYLNSILYYYLKKEKNKIWISNIVSTVIIHFFATIVFISLAYAITTKIDKIIGMLLIRYILSIVIGLFGTIIIYINNNIKEK